MSPRQRLLYKKKSGVIPAVFFWTLFTVLAVIVFVGAVMPLNALRILGFNFYTVSDTGSMEPVLKHNDLIVIGRSDFDGIKEGDIISFAAEIKKNGIEKSAVITHGVVEVLTDPETGQKALRTKGANPAAGEDKIPVTADGAGGTNKYLGKLIFKSTFLGQLTAFITSVYGLTLICVCVFCLTAQNALLEDFGAGK